MLYIHVHIMYSGSIKVDMLDFTRTRYGDRAFSVIDDDDDDDSQHIFSAIYLWNHIQRRLAPQIVIINFTFAGKGMF